MKFCILAFIVSIFYSCGNNNSTIEMKKEHVFNLNYRSLPKYTGIHNDKKTSHELIYFADPITNKCIKFFDINGTLKDSISLKNAIDTIGEIDGISIISIDTILIASLRTNKIIAINKLGKVWYYLNLNKLINEKNGNEYIFHFSSLSNFMEESRDLILNCEWRFNRYDRANDIEPSKRFENVKYYCQKSYETPYFMKISNLFDSIPNIQFGLNGFYKNVSKTPDIFVEPNFHKFINGKVYLYSTFLNTIFEINGITFKIEKKFEIKSNYTTFNFHPEKVRKETIFNFDEKLNYNGKTQGSINRLFYDTVKKEFYVIIFHELKDKTVIKTNGYFRPFSVIIYNQDFTQSHEFNFADSTNYEGYRALLTSEGLMIPIKNKNDENKFIFRLFKFNM